MEFLVAVILGGIGVALLLAGASDSGTKLFGSVFTSSPAAPAAAPKLTAGVGGPVARLKVAR